MYTRRGKQIYLSDATDGASFVKKKKKDDSLDCHVIDLFWQGCKTDLVRINSYKDEAAMAVEEINSSLIDWLLMCMIVYCFIVFSKSKEKYRWTQTFQQK